MNTPSHPIDLDAALAGIPKFFRSKLIKSYSEVKRAFIEGRNDDCVHKSGRFCEILVRWLQKKLTGSNIPFTQKITNFKLECESLENTPRSAGPEGIRILMPRALNYLYSMRNKRDAGHVGGEVDSNPIDAAVTSRIVDWCVCELIRIEHGLSLEEAQSLLDSISVRQLTQVWSILGRKRILDPSLTYAQKTILLLYADSSYAVPTEDLFDWIEHPRLRDYKSKVLKDLHGKKLIEYDQELEMVILSPLGALEVEKSLLIQEGS